MKSLCISAFDLDHTLLKVNSSFRFGIYLYRQKHLPFSALLFIFYCNFCHLIGLFSIQKVHQCAFRRLFLGRSEKIVKQWAEEFLAQKLPALVYKPAVELLLQAKEKGHLTVILSSSPDFVVEPFAKQFGVTFWESSKYAVDKDRCFCQISSLMLGDAKAQYIEKLQREIGGSKENIFAYSDSHHDLPFLLAAGKAIAVNPNRKLRKMCRKMQWPII